MLWEEIRKALTKNADKTLGEKDKLFSFGEVLKIAEERAKKLKKAMPIRPVAINVIPIPLRGAGTLE